MPSKESVLVWLAESNSVNGAYFYIDEEGHAAYTFVVKFALRFRTEDGCQSYIDEFALTGKFKPTCHCFD